MLSPLGACYWQASWALGGEFFCVTMKICGICKTEKPLSEFYKNKKDKLCGDCKTCRKKRTKRWKKENPQKRAVTRSMWKKQNPEKHKAHKTIEHAVERGTIKKPDQCHQCGSSERIQAHHHDYSKPHDVIWLCAECHRLMHVAIRDDGHKLLGLISSNG